MSINVSRPTDEVTLRDREALAHAERATTAALIALLAEVGAPAEELDRALDALMPRRSTPGPG